MGRIRSTQRRRPPECDKNARDVDDVGEEKENVELGKDPKPPGTHFKGAPMPFFMRIVGGVGMHAGYLPGYPASHGCIRMPQFMAENFFKSVSVGTPVTITD